MGPPQTCVGGAGTGPHGAPRPEAPITPSGAPHPRPVAERVRIKTSREVVVELSVVGKVLCLFSHQRPQGSLGGPPYIS